MSRTLGTVARGVRTPIFREGDNVVDRSFLRTVTHSSFENFQQLQSFPAQLHF